MLYQLAQINIAKLRAPLDDPLLAEFVANLDIVNEAAEQADGFVWRLKDDTGNATDYQYFGPDYIVNLSVWRDIKSLRAYIMSEPHRSIMVKKQNWFLEMDRPHLALWWVPAGHVPDSYEADKKLETLSKLGATSDAFTFRNTFPAPKSE